MNSPNPQIPAVSLLTANAATDDLTLDDYRQIYDELREGHSLRQFVERIGSTYSDAWWSRYENGDIRFTRRARNELRRAVNLPELPPAVAELLADPAVVSPNASVYRLGAVVGAIHESPLPPANRVVLIGEQITGLTIHVNSDLSVVAPAPDSHATQVAAPTRRALRKMVHLSPGIFQRFNAARSDAGYTVNDFLTALLDHWNKP